MLSYREVHACRVANLGNDGSIDAGRVNLQYWFNGPSDIPEAADPLSQFTMICLDTTTGGTRPCSDQSCWLEGMQFD